MHQLAFNHLKKNLHESSLESIKKYKIGTKISKISLLFNTKYINFFKKIKVLQKC